MFDIPYASVIGSIMYAMLCTRRDVSHALSLTSRYQSDPGEEHWKAVKNIQKYLKRTKEMFFVYEGCAEELGVTGYVDASFYTYQDDLKSQTVYVFFLGERRRCELEKREATHSGSIYNGVGVHCCFESGE